MLSCVHVLHSLFPVLRLYFQVFCCLVDVILFEFGLFTFDFQLHLSKTCFFVFCHPGHGNFKCCIVGSLPDLLQFHRFIHEASADLKKMNKPRGGASTRN